MLKRPTSPHLSVYRFAHTMAMSITHRFTGLLLALGLCVGVYWLVSVASGESDYERAALLLSAWYFKVLLLAWLAAFCYHLVNGLRHLVWDAGFGLEKASARVSARWVMLIVLVGFVVAGYFLFCPQWGAR